MLSSVSWPRKTLFCPLWARILRTEATEIHVEVQLTFKEKRLDSLNSLKREFSFNVYQLHSFHILFKVISIFKF